MIPGETVTLRFTLDNTNGTVDATGVAVSVSSSDLTVLTPALVLGTVLADGSVETVYSSVEGHELSDPPALPAPDPSR